MRRKEVVERPGGLIAVPALDMERETRINIESKRERLEFTEPSYLRTHGWWTDD